MNDSARPEGKKKAKGKPSDDVSLSNPNPFFVLNVG
jgi:hypothetical protein